MKISAILPAFAILAATAHAQTPALKPGSVEGVVTSTVSGEPVKKAVVTLASPQTTASHNTITDAQGHFQFDSVSPGTYIGGAVRDGFEPASRQPSGRITVAEEQHVQDVTLKLVPFATVSGHVLDEDGEPVPRAQISVLRYSYGPGRKQLNQGGLASTNDLGEFEALNIPPGRYYFQVMAPPLRGIPSHTRWAVPEEAYPSTFYPNAREIGQATPTDIAPGAHVTNIDFRLHKVPAYHIRGTATRGTGTDIPGSSFIVHARWSGSNFDGIVAQSPIRPDESFDLRGLPGGSYRVSCIGFSSGQAFLEYQTVQVSDSDVNGVALTPRAEVHLSGTVTVEGPQPEKMDLQVVLSSAEQLNPAGIEGHVDSNGKLEIRDVPGDVSDLRIVNVPPGKYVKSIRLGDQEIKSGEIDLTQRSNAALNIVLGADGGEVDGNVQTAGGQPSPGTQVTLAPAEEYDGRSDLLKNSLTDASGNFQLKDVAPGEYKVFAWERPDSSSQSAEFRKPFESRSVAVTVGPQEKASVQLSVIPAGEIEKERSKLP